MLFFLPLLCADVYAIPQTLSQQGRLLDNYGTPVEGNHYLTFRIFENTVSTQALFEETLSVNFENGFYMVVLGDSSSNPLDSELFATPPLFLELQLDSEIPFFPRQLLNSIPYSLRTGVAESVEGGSVSASLIEVGGTVVIDSNGSWVGPTMNLNWTDIQGVPQGFADGVDNDTTLSEIEVENMIVNGPLDLAEGTTIGGKFLQEVISCQPGQILQYDGTLGWSCAEDSVLTSDDVLGYVTQNPIDLASGSMINGDSIVTSSTDQVLSESDVKGYITNDMIDLADGSSVNEQDIVTQEAPCSDGQILVYSMSTGSWACGNDSDTTLTASEVQAMVESVSGLALQAGATVDGSPILTEASSINPSQVDTTGSVAGQILTSDGNVLNWTDGGSSGCTVEESFRTYPVKIRLQCGSDTYIVNGSTLVASEFSQFGPWAGNHYCVISNTEEVFCWGQDDDRQVSDSPSGSFTSLASGSHFNCGIQTDESVVCWGRDTSGQVSDAPNGSFTSLSLGETHACGIQTNGSVVCWGWNGEGQVSDSPSGSFTNLSSGENHTCGIQMDGSVVCWGLDNYGQVSNAPSGSFTSLSSGKHFNCGIQTDGSVVCWGLDNYGQVGGTPNGNFTNIQAAHQHICGIKSDESLICWGRDDYGQVSDTPSGNFTATSGGDYHTCGIRTDGSITCWGYQYSITGTPPTGNFSAIQSNEQSNCGILDSGNVICWGNSSYNQTSPP